MTTPRKTDSEFLSDSFNRAERELMTITQNDEDSYFVFNQSNTNYYIVTIDNESEKVLECTCPHYYYRLSALQIPCKHIITVSLYLGYDY